MGCPHCGCRLLTKAGPSRTILICSDCGNPKTPSLGKPVSPWHHLFTVLLVVLASGVALSLAVLSDLVAQDRFPMQDQPEREAPH